MPDAMGMRVFLISMVDGQLAIRGRVNTPDNLRLYEDGSQEVGVARFPFHALEVSAPQARSSVPRKLWCKN